MKIILKIKITNFFQIVIFASNVTFAVQVLDKLEFHFKTYVENVWKSRKIYLKEWQASFFVFANEWKLRLFFFWIGSLHQSRLSSCWERTNCPLEYWNDEPILLLAWKVTSIHFQIIEISICESQPIKNTNTNPHIHEDENFDDFS